MINRMMANHSYLRSHLGRIGIVESLMYVCSQDHKTMTIYHVLWFCERFDAKKADEFEVNWQRVGNINQDILGEETGGPIRGAALSLGAAIW
jgi:hypothetical protein